MDKLIIEQLQLQSNKYIESFNNFAYKNDPIAVFEFEYQYYLTPIIENILPSLSKRLFEFPNEQLDYYLPYISERYHSDIRLEVNNLIKTHDYLNKKKSKEISSNFSNEVLKYTHSTINEKEGFIIQFITSNLSDVISLSYSSPNLCLSLISQLRNPRLQSNLLKQKEISQNLYQHINETLVHESWDTWIDLYFTYPRTKDMNEYFSKWIGRDKIHIKMSSHLFYPEYYEQAKIWLKGREKQQESKR